MIEQGKPRNIHSPICQSTFSHCGLRSLHFLSSCIDFSCFRFTSPCVGASISWSPTLDGTKRNGTKCSETHYLPRSLWENQNLNFPIPSLSPLCQSKIWFPSRLSTEKIIIHLPGSRPGRHPKELLTGFQIPSRIVRQQRGAFLSRFQ